MANVVLYLFATTIVENTNSKNTENQPIFFATLVHSLEPRC